MNKYQKGFAPIIIALIVLILAGVGGTSYYLINKQSKSLDNQNQQPSTVPSITIISPKQGESLETGKTYDIAWSSQNIEKVSFYLQKQGETDVVLTMGNDTQASSGKYSWTIPTDNNDINLGGQFRIGIFADDNNSPIVYSDWFSIISSATSNGWKTYKNDAYGFEFKYPADLIKDIENENSVRLSGSNFNVIFGASGIDNHCSAYPLTISSQKFENINIVFNKVVSKGKMADATLSYIVQYYTTKADKCFYFEFMKDFGSNSWYSEEKFPDSLLPYKTFNAIVSTFKFTKEETNNNEIADWKTYTNGIIGFEFKYPTDWVVDDNYDVKILSPEWKKNTEEGSNICGYCYNISINYKIVSETLEEYISKNQGGFSGNPKKIKFAGENAYEVVNAEMLTTNGILVKKNNYLYNITIVPGNKTETTTKTENQILSSFKFLK